MTKEEILNYVMDTPENTNRMILNDMLDNFSSNDTEVSDLKSAFDNVDSEFVHKNLFDKTKASIISVMGNNSNGLVSGGGVSSVAIPVKPSTQYTLSFWGGDRRLVWETEAYPVVGGTWVVNDGEMSVSGETVGGNNRYVKTITTGATTHYLLLYFYTNSSGAEGVLNTIQLELGALMTAYQSGECFTLPNLVPGLKATNLFDKSAASVVSIAINATTLQFVFGGGVSSVVCPCKPSTKYTVAWRGAGSPTRYYVGPSASYPAINGYATTRIELSSVSSDGRHYGTFTTGASDKYLLLWFYSETSGGDGVLDSIQVNEGETLQDYSSYGFYVPNLNLPTGNLYGDPLGIEFMPDYIINLLGYRGLGALDKGYICLVSDDGTSDIADVSFAISQNKNVPITFALWSTSACITDASLFSQLQTMLTDYNCSVAQHGVGNFATDYTPESLITYLNNEQAAWVDIGITPKGMVYPNHGHNAYVRTICGSFYDVCCTGGASGNKDHVYANDTLGTRSNMFALYRVSTYSTSEATLKSMCDSAYDNKRLLIIWWHDNDIVNEATQISKINNVIDYAKTKGLEFITVGDIPTL